MVKSKVTKRFASVKRMVNPAKDQKLKDEKKEKDKKRKELLQQSLPNKIKINEIEAEPSHMFFKYNTALGPPYRLLLDTNFVNFSIQNKLDIFKASMDCLLGKCIPCVTDCVIAELEKLGHKYRLALRLTKDPRFRKLKCDHSGTYADDCIAMRVKQDRVYIVATCDKDLKRRIRKIPGVPIMYIANHKYAIERLPGAFGAAK